MKSIDNICVVIQARLSSERVPQKMIKPFAGTTITDIAVKTVLESKVIPRDNFYLSLYEEELKDIANKHGANIFHRSKESAFSEGTPLTLMYEWWNKLPYDYCVLVNACAPFLTTETIDSFYKTMNTGSSGNHIDNHQQKKKDGMDNDYERLIKERGEINPGPQSQ